MKHIKRIKFVKSLRNLPFVHFCQEFSELVANAGYEEDSTALMVLVRQMEECNNASRKNEYVEQVVDLYKDICHEVATLGVILRYDGDQSCTKAYELYKRRITISARRGMREFIEAVESFLADLGDMEFDDIPASSISTIRILLSRYFTTCNDRDEEYVRLKNRPKMANLRVKAYDLVAVICYKMMSADYDSKTQLSDDISHLFNKYHADFCRKHKSDDEEDEKE